MKILSYILSPIFLVVFLFFLTIFHPLQWIGRKVFGEKTHESVVDLLNFFLTKSMLIIGVTVGLKNEHILPTNATLVFVANHQSISDIPPIGWYFRKHHPKFVAKIELGKNIPSVSFNLKNGGSALIDRNDPRQAIAAIGKFSKNIHKNNWSAVIFPEGTRSKTGNPKPFATSGLRMITKYNPDGFIVPLTINNSWKIFKYGKFPFGLGSPITITTHKPIKISSLPFDELLETIETTIKKHIV
ncbi:MAG: lysophospholipid acyltransferase family protein [Polaribacter sp.]|nr:lysophospholipid acyltransferase family protein [Polaribacter sp.]